MAKRVKDLMGLSESAWVSLAVKSLRIGWPNGLRAAVERLNPSRVKGLAICGVFEDIFPTREQVYVVLQRVKEAAWDELCSWDTHHGRGYTDEFCDLEKEAVSSSRNLQEIDRLMGVAKALGVYISSRALNCLWTWDKIRPTLDGDRMIDETPFTTMPPAMLDMHTAEGKMGGRRVTLLSGSYAQHRKIGLVVRSMGWEDLRRRIHGGEA